MRIINIAGNGSWIAVTGIVARIPLEIIIQNSTSVVTSVRFADNPTETYTIKAGDVLILRGWNQENQLEVHSVSGTIQILMSGKQGW